MNEPTNSFWWKFWGRPVRFFTWLTMLSLLGWLGGSVILDRIHRGPNWSDAYLLIPALFFVLFALALIGLILSAIPRTRPTLSWVLRRWFFCLAALATLIALFYAEENWRGQRALDRAKQELAAKSVVLDWDKFIPPAVPADQNVFGEPKMQQWFVKADGKIDSHELFTMFESQTNFPIWGDKRKIESESEARAYLAWSDQFQPQFTFLRNALKRPYSRMDGDYASIMTLPFPNYLSIRLLARIFAQRAHCYLLVHEPEKAVAELALMHDLSHLTDCKPTGKPMTLVGGMINVSLANLHADVVGEGLSTHGWREPQLIELQRQLSEVHTMIPVAAAFQTEPAASARALETVPIGQILNAFRSARKPFGEDFFRLAPRGWVLQNIANEVLFFHAPVEAFDTEHERISPSILKENQARLEQFVSHRSFFRILVATMVPNIQKAAQTTARNQAAVDQALIACALERYRIANGSYPDSLDALVPKFLDKVPHDIITGEPMKYRRTDGNFVLYSIGWNEKDDGGIAPATMKNGAPDPDHGDWVWSYPAK